MQIQIFLIYQMDWMTFERVSHQNGMQGKVSVFFEVCHPLLCRANLMNRNVNNVMNVIDCEWDCEMGSERLFSGGVIHLCNLWQKINSALLLIVRFCTPLLCFTTLLQSFGSAMIQHNNMRSVVVLFVAAVVLGGWNTRSGGVGRWEKTEGSKIRADCSFGGDIMSD